MNIKKIIFTILVILWMVTIFYFSHQQGTGSSNTSKKVSMFIVNILDIQNQLQEEQKEEIVQEIEPIVRKLAHFSLYALGGFLIVNCAYTYLQDSKKVIVYSCLIGVLYAASDELHQLLVNGRSGKITDVVIDSLGIFTGIAVYLFIKKIIENIVHRKKMYKGGD